MYQVQKHAVLPYNPAEVFAVVADIPAYPEFLPWCGGARILAHQASEVTAEIDIVYGGLKRSFSSQNRFVHDQSMEMRLIKGPFRMLEGLWCFDAHPVGTRISLDLRFDFSHPLAAVMLATVFRHASESMVAAFVKRTHAVYGASPAIAKL